MPCRLRVALLIESAFAVGREIQRGIAAYAHAHGPWTFFHQARLLHDPAPVVLRKWGPTEVRPNGGRHTAGATPQSLNTPDARPHCSSSQAGYH